MPDLPRRPLPCPKRHGYTLAAYSITVSARSKIDRGTAIPSALAVLRFTAISYFTGNGGVGIEHDCGPLEAGSDLREQLKQLAYKRGVGVADAGDIPARLVDLRDEAAGDGIGHVHKDDR